MEGILDQKDQFLLILTFYKGVDNQLHIIKDIVPDDASGLQNSGGWLRIEQAARTIKGSSGCFGFVKICSVAAEMESNARGDQCTAIHRRLYQDLESHMQSLAHSLDVSSPVGGL